MAFQVECVSFQGELLGLLQNLVLVQGNFVFSLEFRATMAYIKSPIGVFIQSCHRISGCDISPQPLGVQFCKEKTSTVYKLAS